MPKDPDTVMDSLEDLEDDVDVPVMGVGSPEASNISSPAIKPTSRLKRLDISTSAKNNQQKQLNSRVRVTHHYSEDESEDDNEDAMEINTQIDSPDSSKFEDQQGSKDEDVIGLDASKDEAEGPINETRADDEEQLPKEEEEFWDEEDELAQTLAPPSSGQAADHDGEGDDDDAASGQDGDSETEMDNPWRAARGGPERIGGSDSVMLPVEAPAMSDVLARMQARKAELAARAKAKLPNALPPASHSTVAAQEASAPLQQPISFSDLLARAKAKRKQQQQQQGEAAMPVNSEPKAPTAVACVEATAASVIPHADGSGAVECRPAEQLKSCLPTDMSDNHVEMHGNCTENDKVSVGNIAASAAPNEGPVPQSEAMAGFAVALPTSVPESSAVAAADTTDDADIELEIVEDPDDQQHREQVSAAAELAELTGDNAGNVTATAGQHLINQPGLPTRKTFGRGILGRTAARLGSVLQVNHGVVVPAARMDSTETQHAAALLAASSNPGPALQGSAAQAFIDQDAECDEDEIEMSGSGSDDDDVEAGSDSEMIDASQDENDEEQQDASEDGDEGSGSGSEQDSDNDSDKPVEEDEQLEPEPLAFEENEPEYDTQQQEEEDQAVKKSSLLDKMREGQRLLALAKKKKAARAAAGHGGFIEAEAELSDDEGLGLGGGGVSDDEEEGQGDDAMLAELLGTAKEGAKDESKRLKLHHQWEHERDNVELQKVVHAMRHGYKRNGSDRRMLGGEDGTDADARRRRAMLFGDAQMEAEDEGAQGEATWVLPLDKDMEGVEEEEGQEAAHDTAYAAEQHEMRKRLRTASGSEERTGSGLLSHKASDEIRALVRTAKSGEGLSLQASRQPAGKQSVAGQANNPQPAGGVTTTKSTFAIFGRDLTNKAAQPTAGPGGPSFVGRAAAIAHRTTSTMGGRSFVFGSSEHSNSTAAATLQEASKDVHTNPSGRQGSNAATTFAEVKNMIGNAKSMAPPTRQHSGASGPQGAKFDANLFKLLRHTSA